MKSKLKVRVGIDPALNTKDLTKETLIEGFNSTIKGKKKPSVNKPKK